MPEGIKNPKGKVCLLNKSPYRLKQASRQWHAELSKELKELGYDQSKNDYSLFIKRISSFIVIVTVYVDYILITGNNLQEIKLLKNHLHRKFTVKDLGHIQFLGMEVSHSLEGIVLTQHKFTKELLKASGITHYKKVVTPLPLYIKLCF